MINKIRGTTFVALFALCAVASTASYSQTASKNDKADDIVELSPFEVTSKSDRGYFATESQTGTRIPTQIKDAPFVVNITTSEFLDDFAFMEINDNLGYTSTLNGLDQGGGYNLRGFGSSNMLRNGFFRLGMVDRVNVDRIEILKGPNAVMYGQTQPSGLINIITKKPKDRPSQKASLTFGSFDQWREEVSLTGPIPALGNTRYLISAAAYDRGFDYASYSAQHTRTVSGVIDHEFKTLGTLTLEVEYMSRAYHAPIQGAAYTYDSGTAIKSWNTTNMTAADYNNPNTGRRYIGVVDALKDYEPNGPNSTNDRDVASASLTHEKRYNRIFSSRIAGSWYTRHLRNFNNTGVNYYDTVKKTVNRGDPSRGNIDEDGGGMQADLLAQYGLFDNKVKNKTMVTIDYSTYWRYDPTVRLNAIYRNDPNYYVKNQDPLNPDRRIPDNNNNYFNEITRWDKNRVDVMGTLLRHQAAFFDNRAIGYAGVRFDKVKFSLREQDYSSYNTGGFNGSYKYDVTATSPMIGANVKVVKPVAVYVNWSKSFDPRVQSTFAKDINSNGGVPLPSETAAGWDYGVKCSFLNDTLGFTLGGFYINRKDIKVTDIDPSGNAITIAGGDQLVRGVEFDGTWKISSELSWLAGYGHVDSRQTNAGRDIDALGRAPKNLPADTAYTAIKYDFRNTVLKGLSANLGIRYVGRMCTANPTDGGLVEPNTIGGVTNPNKGLIFRNDGRRDIYTAGYTLVEFGIRYRIKRGSVTHTLGLNVSNALNADYYATNKRDGETRSGLFSYSISH